MQDLANSVRKLRADFILSEAAIEDIAVKFQKAMVDGIGGKKSSLKMLPAFLEKPTGKEKGAFIAVDFGGTNARILLVELKGHGNFEILDRRAFPLKNDEKDYDFTSEEADGTELFDFVAGHIKGMLQPGASYPLGFTFSFPSRQESVDQAILIKWTKEIKTSGVEGRDVAKLLREALEHQKINQVIPKAIINDTVGTLLTSAYGDPHADIGSICGTGHNTCYVEPYASAAGNHMIINMESGNFNELPFTRYDTMLDSQSDIPGEQCLEKMASGKYIGELTRLIINDFIVKGQILQDCRSDIFTSPYTIRAEDVSKFLGDESSELTVVSDWLKDVCGISESLLEERITLRTIASIAITRSVQLAAATYLGVLKHIDPQLEKQHTIAIDGSLYEFTPGYAVKLRATLNNLFKDKADLVTVKLTKGGSGVGAAIAAAITD